MRTLVVGCDVSGKSSLVEAIAGCYGDTAFESASTDESRDFRRRNLITPVDDWLIDARENLYMGVIGKNVEVFVPRFGCKDTN